ncbi:hypothetical protein WR25_22606 isoform A [Diploscapter pachys]|uniref:Uncharacterized protein n=1 Tax=Diploscapter pachys TaxID=2018661 RepID=A0A2A2JP53_9BILA|nr:hypothetical protein WR25_22606 isoform A [Diploscapter pachys]
MESRPSPSAFNRHIRILICGAGKTGKSTVVQGFCTHIDESGGWRAFLFDDEEILIDVKEASNWRKNYASDYDGFLVIFSADDDYTFNYALEIIAEIQNCGTFPTILVECKNDLILEESAEQIEIDNEVRRRKLRMYSICGFDESHIVHPFAYLVEKLTRNEDSESPKARGDLRKITEVTEPNSRTSVVGSFVAKDKETCKIM